MKDLEQQLAERDATIAAQAQAILSLSKTLLLLTEPEDPEDPETPRYLNSRGG
jgi:hypothetical protein